MEFTSHVSQRGPAQSTSPVSPPHSSTVEAFVDDDVAQGQWRSTINDDRHDVVAGLKIEGQRPPRSLAGRHWIALQLLAVARALVIEIEYVLVFAGIFVTDILLLPGDREIFSG